MSQFIETGRQIEKVVIVGAVIGKQAPEIVEEYLDELEFLVDTAGGSTLIRYVQKLDRPVPATYIGKGKLEEIKVFVEENQIDLVVFDDELSAS